MTIGSSPSRDNPASATSDLAHAIVRFAPSGSSAKPAVHSNRKQDPSKKLAAHRCRNLIITGNNIDFMNLSI
jgi:hypothetical protein